MGRDPMEGYIDYSEPLTLEQRAANNPLTASRYREARENDDYYTMAECERAMVRPDPTSAAYQRKFNAITGAISVLLMLIVFAALLL